MSGPANADIRLDGPTLRFCVRYLRRRAETMPPSTSKASPIRKALHAAADELLAWDEMFGDAA